MPAIPRRDIDFALDPKVVPRNWMNGDAFATTICCALSLLFPEGERFFVDSVKRMQPRLPKGEKQLQRDVAGFIGQEAMHGREHRALNELLVAHGFTQAPRVERRLRGLLQFIRRVFTAKSQLAITCALEHFTALLGEVLLGGKTGATLREEFHPSIRNLWTWHALEETEHKSVAFDVYKQVGGGYFRRCMMMIVVTIGFLIALTIITSSLMVTRGLWWRPWTWFAFPARLFLWPGHIIRKFPAYLSYFRPGFHPTDRDTTDLVTTWRAVFD